MQRLEGYSGSNVLSGKWLYLLRADASSCVDSWELVERKREREQDREAYV